MNLNYSNACKEILVLFDYFLDEDDLSKIPEEQIIHIRNNASPDYTYIIDETKGLEEQTISKEAKAIILSLYKKYFADDEQKMKINEIIYMLDNQKINNPINNNLDVFKPYKSDLKENENLEIKSNENAEKNNMTLVKKESIWKRIVNKFLTFFHLK